MELLGGCLCGSTRYVLYAEPDSLCDCHCIDCRRSSGAPYVTWGAVPRDRMKVIKGELRRVSFAGRVRSFASCCGTQLFFEESPTCPNVDVTIASLDDPSRFHPKRIIWTEDRLPWVVLDEKLPSFPRSSVQNP